MTGFFLLLAQKNSFCKGFLLGLIPRSPVLPESEQTHASGLIRPSLSLIFDKWSSSYYWKILQLDWYVDLASAFYSSWFIGSWCIPFISTYQTKPRPGHLDAVKHVKCYIKASAYFAFEYSSGCRHHVKVYIHFLLIPRHPKPPVQVFPLPLSWHLLIQTGVHRMPLCQTLIILIRCQLLTV